MHVSCRCQATVVLAVIAVVAVLPANARLQNVAHNHKPAPAAAAGDRALAISGLAIPDVELVDQHGQKVRFYSGLVKGKVVAINTIFTTCTTICPLMGANFSKISELLADADRGKVSLISISIDPVVDTPERLEQWSRGFGQTGPAWTLLTGSRADINALLKSLQVFTAEKQDHAPVVLIGGDGAGDWARAPALLSPSRLADLIRSRLARMAAGSMPKL